MHSLFLLQQSLAQPTSRPLPMCSPLISPSFSFSFHCFQALSVLFLSSTSIYISSPPFHSLLQLLHSYTLFLDLFQSVPSSFHLQFPLFTPLRRPPLPSRHFPCKRRHSIHFPLTSLFAASILFISFLLLTPFPTSLLSALICFPCNFLLSSIPYSLPCTVSVFLSLALLLTHRILLLTSHPFPIHSLARSLSVSLLLLSSHTVSFWSLALSVLLSPALLLTHRRRAERRSVQVQLLPAHQRHCRPQ